MSLDSQEFRLARDQYLRLVQDFISNSGLVSPEELRRRAAIMDALTDAARRLEMLVADHLIAEGYTVFGLRSNHATMEFVIDDEDYCYEFVSGTARLEDWDFNLVVAPEPLKDIVELIKRVETIKYAWQNKPASR